MLIVTAILRQHASNFGVHNRSVYAEVTQEMKFTFLRKSSLGYPSVLIMLRPILFICDDLVNKDYFETKKKRPHFLDLNKLSFSVISHVTKKMRNSENLFF